MRYAKPLLTLIILLAVAGSPATAFGSPTVSHASPKKANFYLKWTVSDQEARELAKFDLVVLDMEVQGNNPGSMRLMRELNPGIKIVAYITASEIRSDATRFGSIAALRRDLFAAIPDSWYVTDARGTRRSFWSGTWIVNVTDKAPLVGGSRWNSYLPRFVKDRIMSTGLWDGVMYDNAWENITYFAGGAVDLDRNGAAESVASADALWRDGLRTIYRTTRALLPDALVLENDGPLYAADVHGLQFENFPNGGWQSAMSRMANATNATIPPKLIMVNTNTGNTGNQDDFRKFRYGFSSALLVDAYAGFDYGDRNHGQTWWYDEYDARIGTPTASAARIDGTGTGFRPGVWRREYGRGVVLVNSGTTEKTVNLGGEYERLHGTQDTAINSGAIASRVTVAAADGIILYKPLGEVRGTPFRNGSFVRIFNSAGTVQRTGFFAYADRFPSSAQLLTRVADGMNREVVVADGPRIRVYEQGYSLLADFAPFGDRFTGGLNVVFGNLTGPGSAEIVVSGATSGGGLVRVFSTRGSQIAEFRAFGETYQGGAAPSVADVTGDGKAEIVVGAGPGGGPHVRIFDAHGGLVHAGFFAYDPRFRGGVSLATGDVTGDGKAEIVVGAGPGGGPHVRIFDGEGRLLSQFFAFDKDSRSGAAVGVADIDHDGRQEVLAFSLDLSGIAGSGYGHIAATAPMTRLAAATGR